MASFFHNPRTGSTWFPRDYAKERIQMSKYADIEIIKEHILAATTKALDLAIEEIPTINVKEYIDKEQAYMEGYAKGVIYGGLLEGYGLDKIEYKPVIKTPSGEIIGKWIVKENGNCECSVCGREMQLGFINYCGNCGAYMKG